MSIFSKSNCILTALCFLFDQVALTTVGDDIRFVTLGDAGQPGDALTSTANTIGAYLEVLPAKFVAMLGDNFYPGGIDNVDDPVFRSTFVDRFSGIDSTFYPVLGDNDYGKGDKVGSLSAQVDLTGLGPQWSMPSLYYSKILSVGSVSICSVFIDTQSLIDIPNLDQRTPEELALLENQLLWLESVLSSQSCQSSNFILVFGHHTVVSSGKKHHKGKGKAVADKLMPLFSKYFVDAYFSGHDHDLQAITENPCEGHCMSFIVSGASSRLRQTPKSFSLEGFAHWGVNDTLGFTVSHVEKEEMITGFITSAKGDIIHTHTTRSHLALRSRI